MTEAARAEVHADPDAVVGLVAEQVDVVVARADGAELRGGEVGELALRLERRCRISSMTAMTAARPSLRPTPNEIRVNTSSITRGRSAATSS